VHARVAPSENGALSLTCWCADEQEAGATSTHGHPRAVPGDCTVSTKSGAPHPWRRRGSGGSIALSGPRQTARRGRVPAQECEPRIAMCDGLGTSARSRAIELAAPGSSLPGTAVSSRYDRVSRPSFRTPRSPPHESWNARGERSLPRAATFFVARTAQPSWPLNCPARLAGDRTASDRCQYRRSGSVRLR
jgi:hypothetical protein